jgi:hypothetical protein
MNEQTKTAAVSEQGKAAAPAGTTDPKSGDLTVQDLNTIKAIIDVASQRGAFKANEMQAVGTTYNKLEAFLNAIQAQQAAAAKSTPAAVTTAPVGDKK